MRGSGTSSDVLESESILFRFLGVRDITELGLGLGGLLSGRRTGTSSA